MASYVILKGGIFAACCAQTRSKKDPHSMSRRDGSPIKIADTNNDDTDGQNEQPEQAPSGSDPDKPKDRGGDPDEPERRPSASRQAEPGQGHK